LYEYIDNNFLLPDKFVKNPKKLEIINLLRESANNILQVLEDLSFFVFNPTLDEELKASIKVDRDLMINFKEELNEVDFKDKFLIGVFLDSFLNKNNLKFPMLGKPLRLILTGRSKAPSITDLLFLIGKKDSVQRIDNYLET
jgi:glutamyl-tRNA synthetase